MAKAAALANGFPLPPLALRGQPGMAVLPEPDWRAGGGNTQFWTGLDPSGCIRGSRLRRCEAYTHTHTYRHKYTLALKVPRRGSWERERGGRRGMRGKKKNEDNCFAGGGLGH